MAAHAQPRFTPEQYLAFDRSAEQRHEYYDGAVHAMAGGSPNHNHIVGNLTREFGVALKKQPCLVMPSDARIRTTSGRFFMYPDLVIACEPREFADDRKDTLLKPTLVVEVLSPSTEMFDRDVKLDRYRTILSLQEYMMVSQFEPSVEIFRRGPGSDWTISHYEGLQVECEIRGLPGGVFRILLAEIYEKIEFPLSPEPQA
jgi:Uma2 family endonuclease